MKNPALLGASSRVQPAGVTTGFEALTNATSVSPDCGAWPNVALNEELVPCAVTPVFCTTVGTDGDVVVEVAVGTGVGVGRAVLVGAGEGVAVGIGEGVAVGLGDGDGDGAGDGDDDGAGDGDGAPFTITVGLQLVFVDWYQR
jgi:hypothetical protein